MAGDTAEAAGDAFIEAPGKENTNPGTRINETRDESEQESGSAKSTVMAKPKRPMSAYFHYLDTRRAKVKEDHPNMKMTERQKIMAKEWREMEPNEKKKFEYIADESKKKYAVELKKYEDWLAKQPKTDDSKEDSTPEKDIPRPKKAMSAFLHYMSKNRATVKTNKPGEVMKALSVKWKELKGDEKKEYEDLAKKDKERYKSEMAIYEKMGVKEKVDPVATIFPLAKVKRIIMLDQSIQKISKEATWLITKAAESFLDVFSKKVQQEAARSGRKGLNTDDLEISLRKYEAVSFLKLPMTRYIKKSQEERKRLNELNAGKKRTISKAAEVEKGKYKSRTITSMFAPRPKKPKKGGDEKVSTCSEATETEGAKSSVGRSDGKATMDVEDEKDDGQKPGKITSSKSKTPSIATMFAKKPTRKAQTDEKKKKSIDDGMAEDDSGEA